MIRVVLLIHYFNLGTNITINHKKLAIVFNFFTLTSFVNWFLPNYWQQYLKTDNQVRFITSINRSLPKHQARSSHTFRKYFASPNSLLEFAKYLLSPCQGLACTMAKDCKSSQLGISSSSACSNTNSTWGIFTSLPLSGLGLAVFFVIVSKLFSKINLSHLSPPKQQF